LLFDQVLQFLEGIEIKRIIRILVEAKDGDEGEGTDVETSKEARDEWRNRGWWSIVDVWTSELMLQFLPKFENMRGSFEMSLSRDGVGISVETNLAKNLRFGQDVN